MSEDLALDQNKTIEDILQGIVTNNPYGFILRPELPDKTGGMIRSPAYIANLDSDGKGIEGRFLIGNTTAYPVDSVIKFLRKKISIPKKKNPTPPGKQTNQSLIQ